MLISNYLDTYFGLFRLIGIEKKRKKGPIDGNIMVEGLEELRERLWEPWEGARGMKFGRVEVQNCESGVRRYVSG